MALLLADPVVSRDVQLLHGEAPNNGAKHACPNLGPSQCCSIAETTFGQVVFDNLELGDNLEVWGPKGDWRGCNGRLLHLILVAKADGPPRVWSGDAISGALIRASPSSDKKVAKSAEKGKTRKKRKELDAAFESLEKDQKTRKKKKLVITRSKEAEMLRLIKSFKSSIS